MNVKQLKAIIKDLPDELPVMLDQFNFIEWHGLCRQNYGHKTVTAFILCSDDDYCMETREVTL